MTPQEFSVLEAVVLLLLTSLLFTFSLVRRYPVRSIMVYGALAACTLVGAIAAVGAYSLTSPSAYIDISTLSFVTNILRGVGLVVVGALVVFELRHRPVRCDDDE